VNDPIQPSCAPRPRLENAFVEPFREDAACASKSITAKAPRSEHRRDPPSRDRSRARRHDGAAEVAQCVNRAKPGRNNSEAQRDCMELIPSRNQLKSAPHFIKSESEPLLHAKRGRARTRFDMVGFARAPTHALGGFASWRNPKAREENIRYFRGDADAAICAWH
jgi:hypothetical protein